MVSQEFTESWIPLVDADKFSHLLTELYTVVHDPKRSGVVKSKHFSFLGLDTHVVGRIFGYLVESTPMGGLDVRVSSRFGSKDRGKVWVVEKSSVSGPVYYPRVGVVESMCLELRQLLLEGESLANAHKFTSFSTRSVRDHAHGRCNCDVDLSVEFVPSIGWVEC